MLHTFLMIFLGPRARRWSGLIAVMASLAVLGAALVWAAAPIFILQSVGIGWTAVWLVPTVIAVTVHGVTRSFPAAYG